MACLLKLNPVQWFEVIAKAENSVCAFVFYNLHPDPSQNSLIRYQQMTAIKGLSFLSFSNYELDEQIELGEKRLDAPNQLQHEWLSPIENV